MDTSIQDWLEGRGEALGLTARSDDATGQILARFYPGETTPAHRDRLGGWRRPPGRPVALDPERDRRYRVAGQLDPDRPRQTFRRL